MSVSTPFPDVPRRQVLVGDAHARLLRLPGRSLDMVLTSPPYFRCRDYQAVGQLGLESQITDWVTGLRRVTAELARVLVPTGTLWLNLGDSFATHPREGTPRKGLLLGPERLALALVQDGWLLRNKIVWAKPNPVPSPVKDRLTCSWEVIYVFAQQPRYFFDLDAVRLPHTSRATPGTPKGKRQPASWLGPSGNDTRGLAGLKASGRVGHPLGKNPTDVWQLPTSRFRSAHHATFPLALAERAIRAGCPEQRCHSCRAFWTRDVRRLGAVATRGALRAGCDHKDDAEPGLVLDPFIGTGTTAVAAEAMQRDWLGIELNPRFAAIAEQRIVSARPPDDRAVARAA